MDTLTNCLISVVIRPQTENIILIRGVRWGAPYPGQKVGVCDLCVRAAWLYAKVFLGHPDGSVPCGSLRSAASPESARLVVGQFVVGEPPLAARNCLVDHSF
jgi:hypothetical protein